MKEYSLESGDSCFLDNFHIVHGRKPFRARHAGMDRWLKRLNASCGLRMSQGERSRS
jgi:alpha-ketoglutarate-dependent taurine dioxygenase